MKKMCAITTILVLPALAIAHPFFMPSDNVKPPPQLFPQPPLEVLQPAASEWAKPSLDQVQRIFIMEKQNKPLEYLQPNTDPINAIIGVEKKLDNPDIAVAEQPIDIEDKKLIDNDELMVPSETFWGQRGSSGGGWGGGRWGHYGSGPGFGGQPAYGGYNQFGGYGGAGYGGYGQNYGPWNSFGSG